MSDIAEYPDLRSSRTHNYLNELIDEQIVVSDGGNRNNRYKLKG